jgi:elongation factor P
MEVKALDLRRGTKIDLEGVVYTVVDFMHITPGKGRAVMRTKLKSFNDGRVIEKTFTSGEKVKVADLEHRTMQYLYKDGDACVFMDTRTYEQMHLDKELLGDDALYLKENSEISVALYKGAPIGVDLPPKVDLKVVQTVPGVKGDTVSNVMKPATLETGLAVQVPLFINEGDIVRVDTRDGKYVERA